MAQVKAAKAVTKATPAAPVANAGRKAFNKRVQAIAQSKVNAASIAAALQLPSGLATQQAAPAAAVAKLTKRSNVLQGQVLVATGKPVKVRAPHVAQAWAACLAALGTNGTTATVLAQLPQLAHPQCVSPQGFISYMLRRGYLAVK